MGAGNSLLSTIRRNSDIFCIPMKRSFDHLQPDGYTIDFYADFTPITDGFPMYSRFRGNCGDMIPLDLVPLLVKIF